MLKRTALYEEHRKLGGRLIDFGGWELPVQYTGVMDEHLACRAACGLFDVSHMGEVEIEGAKAEALINELVTNNVAKLADGQALYTAMCHPSGGVVDDLLVYRRTSTRYFVVVNASNTDKDFAWMQKVYSSFSGKNEVTLKNVSSQYSQIALQGRLAEKILASFTDIDLGQIQTYWFKEGFLFGEIPTLIARTGYTGEDGFEIYLPWDKAPKLWSALLEKGMPLGLKPCGLGARDTLRLEMKYPLYGNDLTDTTHPLESGLGWVVKWDKGHFVGREALEEAKAQSKNPDTAKQLVGIEVLDRGIPRHGYLIFAPGGQSPIGEVTSGTQSPSTKKAIAMARILISHTKIGSEIEVEVRGTRLKAQVVPTPFYKRPY